jgi:hypothetical protein
MDRLAISAPMPGAGLAELCVAALMTAEHAPRTAVIVLLIYLALTLNPSPCPNRTTGES